MKRGIKILLGIGFIVSLSAHSLREKPALVDCEQLKILEQEWHTEFTWQYKHAAVSFYYSDLRASFALTYFGMPYFWSSLYAVRHIMQEYKDRWQKHAPQYYYAQPLYIKDGLPQKISIDNAAEMLRSKQFVVYTGAGLSAAHDVPTMNALEQSLDLDKGLLSFAKKAFKGRVQYVKSFEAFCHQAIFGEPTPAHYALHALAQERGISIITDNVDLLQQRAGSMPLLSHSAEMSAVRPEDLKAIDAILCIGFSHDDCGLLGFYKTHNPAGVIIAIDFGQPRYLSDADFLVQEDIQEAIPRLHALMSAITA